MDRNSLVYRRGRLQLPRDIADWTPEEVARWLSLLPPDDRVQAFRAVAFAQGVAAFLVMEPADRAALLSGLNRNNRNRLLGLAGTEVLAATLLQLHPDHRAWLLEDVSPHRRSAVDEHMRALAAQEQPEAVPGRARRPWRDTLARLAAAPRWRRRKPAA